MMWRRCWGLAATVDPLVGVCTTGLSSAAFSALRDEQRPELVRSLCARDPVPGMVAYLDETPVGWCALGPRTEMERLQRSRTIPKVDDRPVWSVVCFVVRPGFRRRGVARTLLDGAISYARSGGAVALESYPVDPAGARINTSFAYVGTTGMFAAAGFERVLETKGRSAGLPRWLMRLELSSSGED